MNTLIKKTDKNSILQAAEILKGGGLVAFPTETVYGLGGIATQPSAIEKIYAVKGRPSDNPLILHISDISMLSDLSEQLPRYTQHLIRAFWPGPLTLVVKKQSNLNFARDFDTIGVRMPKNEIALSLISGCGEAIAAPSANTSGRPSPTCAGHVAEDLGGKIEMILDGGFCEIGLESTVLDISGEIPVLLRPGAITPDMLKPIIGEFEIATEASTSAIPKSPGMKYMHYAPKAQMTLVLGDVSAVRQYIQKLADDHTAILTTSPHPYKGYTIHLGKDEGEVAANLFLALRKCDQLGFTKILAEGCIEEGLGLAIMNRMKKAASYNIVKL